MCQHCSDNENVTAQTQLELPIAAVEIGQENAIETVDCEACCQTIERDNAHDIGGSPYCESCADEHGECCSCSTVIHDDESIVSNDGDRYCRDCYSDQFTICDACSVEIASDEAICPSGRYHRDYGPFCADCYNDRFFECYGCGCETRQDDGADGPDDERYCDSCFCDRFCTCEDCGCVLDNDDAVCTDDGTYCSDCAPDERDSVDLPYCSSEKTGFLTQRAFAVELEVIDSGRSASELSEDDWQCERDGSLPGEGREYVSGPIAGQRGIDKIANASAVLTENDATITRACGFHLHIDATSESGATVAKFMRLAKRLEKWAFSTVSGSRRANRYCERLKDYAAQVSTERDVERVVYNSNNVSRGAKREKYNSARYYWVNAHSWFYRGTVEIRLHGGTINATKILAWAELWLKAFEFAKSATIEQIDAIPDDDTAGFALAEKCGIRVETVAHFARRIQLFSSIASDASGDE